MAVNKDGGVGLKNVQKIVNVSSGSLSLTAGGTISKTFTMPDFQLTDIANAFVEDLYWGIGAGTLTGMIWVAARVTGVNQVTLFVTSLVAQTVTLVLDAKVVEYQ